MCLDLLGNRPVGCRSLPLKLAVCRCEPVATTKFLDCQLEYRPLTAGDPCRPLAYYGRCRAIAIGLMGGLDDNRRRMAAELKRYMANNKCLAQRLAEQVETTGGLVYFTAAAIVCTSTAVTFNLAQSLNFRPTSTHGLLCLVALNFLLYARLCVGDPGTVKAKRSDVHLENGSVCGVCGVSRPARAHHCRDCGVCVLRRDHHCVWLRNCVGERNHKDFILFLGYTAILSLVAILITVKSVRKHGLALPLGSLSVLFFHTLVVVALFTGSFYLCTRGMYLVLHNLTARELAEQVANGGSIADNPYDRGWLRNFLEVFGTHETRDIGLCSCIGICLPSL